MYFPLYLSPLSLYFNCRKRSYLLGKLITHQSKCCIRRVIFFFSLPPHHPSVISLVNQFRRPWIWFKVWWAVWCWCRIPSGMFVPIRDVFVPLSGEEPSRCRRLPFLKLLNTITVKLGQRPQTLEGIIKINFWGLFFFLNEHFKYTFISVTPFW